MKGIEINYPIQRSKKTLCSERNEAYLKTYILFHYICMLDYIYPLIA